MSASLRGALGGTELEYLAGLKDLMVINDEAHHIHEIKRESRHTIYRKPPLLFI